MINTYTLSFLKNKIMANYTNVGDITNKYVDLFEKYNIKINIRNDNFFIKNIRFVQSDYLSVLKNLRDVGYKLGYTQQKDLEEKLNCFDWWLSTHQTNKERFLRDISLNNIRCLMTSNGLVYYTNNVSLDNHKPNIENDNDNVAEVTAPDYDFYAIIEKFYNIERFDNKLINLFYKLFNRNVTNDYDKLITFYLESYKEGLLDYIKHNDQKVKTLNVCWTKNEFVIYNDLYDVKIDSLFLNFYI